MSTVAEVAEETAKIVDATRLRRLAEHKSRTVRIAVAQNPAAHDETIERLLSDRDEVVRLASAGNLADRPRLHAMVAMSQEKELRAALARTFARQDHRSLSYEVQAVLSKDPFSESRQGVAETTNYLDLFENLLNDGDPKVRAWCAANPRISREQMERLLTDRSWGVRAFTASAGLRFPDDEQLMRLARDRSASVRWAVLFRPRRPREALELLAEDPDELNRRHARSALLGGIMSDQIEASAQAGRQRALNVAPFLLSPS